MKEAISRYYEKRFEEGQEGYFDAFPFVLIRMA